jgi:hypothetical protein
MMLIVFYVFPAVPNKFRCTCRFIFHLEFGSGSSQNYIRALLFGECKRVEPKCILSLISYLQEKTVRLLNCKPVKLAAGEHCLSAEL